MNELLRSIKAAYADENLSSHEMFKLLAEIFSVAEDYCRGVIGDRDEFEVIKTEVRNFVVEMLKEDNQTIPNWIEPFMEAQMVSLVDPILDSIWENVNE